MSDSAAFDFVCEQLETGSSLDRLEARGTVRLALKAAGLEARSVSPGEMKVVVEKLLPGELATRGVDGADALLASIGRGLASLAPGSAGQTPESVFQRLGGGA